MSVYEYIVICLSFAGLIALGGFVLWVVIRESDKRAEIEDDQYLDE